MKRFIRYLYEYQNEKRTRNTGFVKVLEQTDTAEIQIYGRGFPVAGGRTLEIYLFYEEDGKCIGIRMGEIRGAQAAFGYKLSYTTDDVGGDGQFGRIGGMILRAGNGADAGYYGAVWDEARPVDVSRMITEEEWKLNKSGKNKKIANGGDVLSNEKYEKPGNEKILEEKTSQRKSENIEEQETSEQSKNTDAVRKSKSNPNVPEERNSQLPDFRERNGSLRIIIFCSMDIIITIIWYHLKKKGNAGLGFRDFIFRASSGRQEHLDSVSS
ncbi:MAG: hypothetical protein BHW14_05910 [Coprococcus sp. 43_8]|nr:MAG: hypothetical protein BHW14_05910 [Coprococcus sp. 43_8]